MEPQPARTSAAPDVTAADLARCLTPAAGQHSLTVMMQTLAKGFAADGCVLWETYARLHSSPDPSRDRVLVMASWFQNMDGVYAVHDALVDQCATGKAILSRTAQMFPNLRAVETRSFRADIDFDLRAALAAPVTFADGVRGAVTLYRCGECKPFEQADRACLVDLAPIMPQLYKAIRDAESLNLLIQVSDSLSRLPAVSAHGGQVAPPQLRAVFDKVCKLIEDAFHGRETSLYLRNPLVDPDKYHLAGTTWTGCKLQQWYERNSEGKELTAWVLRNRKPALAFDWATWDQDRDFYNVEYPGLEWTDRMGLLSQAGRVPNNPAPQRFPPLSKVSTPVFLGDDLVGALRCSAGRFDKDAAGPWYYDRNDLQLLNVIAGAIARSWGSYLKQCALIQEQSRSEARAFTDLRHQLHGPLNQLASRSEQLLRSMPPRDLEQGRRLLVVRGLARKARRVALSIDFLATPDEDTPVRVRRGPLARDDLRKRLIELAHDNQMMVDSARNILFYVDRDSLGSTVFTRIQIDSGLLEQAINSLLDNAGKYSYPNTTVRISCGNTSKGNLHITVTNKGIALRAMDVGKVASRSYRTEEAEASVGEGSGIGLWIVRRIMNAHRGFLDIVPTDKEGVTKVKLVFPRME